MSYAEDKTHFSIWAMMAAPLIAGNDIRNMTQQTRDILTNRSVIAIDQDPLGVQGFKFAEMDSLQIWFRPLQNGEWAACFLNRSSRPRQVYFNWKEEQVTDKLYGYELDRNKPHRLYNVWTGKTDGNTDKPLNTMLQPHEVIMYRLLK